MVLHLLKRYYLIDFLKNIQRKKGVCSATEDVKSSINVINGSDASQCLLNGMWRRFEKFRRSRSGDYRFLFTGITGSTTVWFGGCGVAFFKNNTGLVLKGLTIKNTTPNGGGIADALVLDGNATNKFIAQNCKLDSYQDTLLVSGVAWFYNCYITGDTDFIWGTPKVALFENCEINTSSDGGYVVQARCTNLTDPGFIFLNCNLTGASAATTYLARHGTDTQYDNVSYLNCKIGSHIAAEGWSSNPNPATATRAVGWREYNNTGADGTAAWVSQSAGSVYHLNRTEYLSTYGNGTTVDRTTILGYAPSL
jgi:pectin methylesterase-like acyl-CoA thioesterase